MSFDLADNFDIAFTEALRIRQRKEAEEKTLAAQQQVDADLPPPSRLPPPFPDEAGSSDESDAPETDESEDVGFLGTIADIGEQLIGGVRDAGVNIAQTVVDVGGLFDSGINFDDIIPDVDEAETGVGAFARGTAQFLTGFIPALGALKALRATRLVAGVLNKARGVGSVGQALTGEVAKFTFAGAVADFAVFDPHEERLSNIVEEFGMPNPITGFLAADPDDGEFEGRLKSVLEGAALGLLFDGIIRGLRFSKKAASTQIKMVEDDLVLDTTRQEFHASSQEVTFRRIAYSEAKMARDNWRRVGQKGADATAEDASLALNTSRPPATEDGANMLAMAEFRASASGRTVRAELDDIAKPLNAKAQKESPLGVIEQENPELAGKITDATTQSEVLEQEVKQTRIDMDVAEERFYDVVTTDDWRTNFDDVRLPAEKNVDDFVPPNIRDEIEETRGFLDQKNCNL